MASPVGHTLAGIAIYYAVRRHPPHIQTETSWKAILPFVLIPNLPDVDLLLGYLLHGDLLSFHGRLTHTPVFALLASTTIALFRLHGTPLRTFLVSASLLGSHILLDLAAGPHLGSPSARGVMLFYPLSYAEFHLPVGILLRPNLQAVSGLLSLENFLAVLWELFLFLPVILYLSRK